MRFAALAAALLLSAQGAVAAERADRAESVRQPTSMLNLPFPDHDDAYVEGSGFDILHTRDSDRFRSLRVRGAALVDYRSAHDFITLGGGGTRYEQDTWSIDRYTLASTIRKQERGTGAGILATGGISTVGDQQKLIGEGTWNIRASKSGGFEFVGQRDFVETRAALESGIMTNFLAASADYTFADRLTLIGLAGHQWFSDDNERNHLRGRAILSVLPEQGLSLQLRARAYESSQRGGLFYFNPEDYERADIGLRLRRAIAGWRVLAAAGGGRERIDRDVEKPTRYVDLSLERTFASKLTLVLTAVVDRSSESDSVSGAKYTWRYYRAVILLPL